MISGRAHPPGWRALAAIALVALAATLAGCATAGTAATTPGPVRTARVDLPPSYRFVPAAIEVTAGTTVTWSNADHFTHSVQFSEASLAREPLVMEPGAEATLTFSRPGTYAYVCHLHPQDMKGSVTVVP